MRNPTIFAFWTLLAYALWLSAIPTVPSSLPAPTAKTDLDRSMEDDPIQISSEKANFHPISYDYSIH